MKRSKFTEAQIAFAIKQAETGTRVEEVCRKMGISEATFYNRPTWKTARGSSATRCLVSRKHFGYFDASKWVACRDGLLARLPKGRPAEGKARLPKAGNRLRAD